MLIPLGWSFPEGQQLGHHLLVLLEHQEGKAHLRIVDTFINQKNSKVVEQINKIKKDVFPLSFENENPNQLQVPYGLIKRKCSTDFSIHNLNEKIKYIAKILMLQIPYFTKDSCTKFNCKVNRQLGPQEIQQILFDINYSFVKNENEIKANANSPLEEWNWFPSSACAFSSFQPLLQTLALKVSREKNIKLIDREEINLQHYFELLLESYKLFLITKFKIEHDDKDKTLIQRLTSAIDYTIAESGDAIKSVHP